MILEEAASGQIERRNRAQLMRSWVERKIERDLNAATRATPTKILDVGAFIERMIALHESVARQMAEYNDAGWQLTDEIGSEIVEAEAESIFRERHVDISTILPFSVFSTVTPRRRVVMPVRFLLRVCQEFFVASSLHRTGDKPDEWPIEVVDFWNEVETAGES